MIIYAYYMTCLFGLDNMMINILFDIFLLKILYIQENIQWKYTYFLDGSNFFPKSWERIQIYPLWLNVPMYRINFGILFFTAYYKIKFLTQIFLPSTRKIIGDNQNNILWDWSKCIIFSHIINIYDQHCNLVYKYITPFQKKN